MLIKSTGPPVPDEGGVLVGAGIPPPTLPGMPPKAGVDGALLGVTSPSLRSLLLALSSRGAAFSLFSGDPSIDGLSLLPGGPGILLASRLPKRLESGGKAP